MPRSRYTNFKKIIDDNNNARLETFPKITSEKIKSPNDIIITLNDAQRLDSIALQYLGDGRLWWVICLLNDFAFPFGNDLIAGTQIRIPINVDRIFKLIDKGVT